jgi:hypothetical protein
MYESSAEGGTLVVILNQAAQPAELKAPPTAPALLSGNGGFLINNVLNIPARGWAILSSGT